MKKSIGLFFEGLMLVFIFVVCSFGYNTVKAESFKTPSLYTGSINELVMNEGVLYSGLEQLSTNSLDFDWAIEFNEIRFTNTVKLTSRNLFVTSSARNVFYVFITASAP